MSTQGKEHCKDALVIISSYIRTLSLCTTTHIEPSLLQNQNEGLISFYFHLNFASNICCQVLIVALCCGKSYFDTSDHCKGIDEKGHEVHMVSSDSFTGRAKFEGQGITIDGHHTPGGFSFTYFVRACVVVCVYKYLLCIFCFIAFLQYAYSSFLKRNHTLT